MVELHDIIKTALTSKPLQLLQKNDEKRLLIKGLVGSSFSVMVAAYGVKHSGVHIIVADSKDSAGYISNDLTEMLGESRVLFFPSAAKKSVLYEGEDLSSVVLRTAALSAISNIKEGESIYICTYAEAICEKVVTKKTIEENSVVIKVNDEHNISHLIDDIIGYGFVKVDFVYEPGQFSVRGGIVDIFSYGENQPYRLDFFGDTVESIRIFDIASQRSQKSLEEVVVVPYIREITASALREPLTQYVSSKNVNATYWFTDAQNLSDKLDSISIKLAEKRDDASSIVTTMEELLLNVGDGRILYLRSDLEHAPAIASVEFNTTLQPSFNKNFDLLAVDFDNNLLNGYKTYILTRNKAQIERLENIFNSIGKKDILFSQLEQTLHSGYIDNDTKCCYYTDHQIFERYHKYKINREIKKSESVTVSELNALAIGDYVVHIDHGIAKFGGLVKSIEAGKSIEAIKLVFRDNDILLLNVHSLHKISKYRDKDGTPPKLHKLGSSLWQRFKSTTKSKVKDIARDLIALYAKRRMARGFAFSPNTYLQQELEASFMYEDTPDQMSTIEAVYRDMESPTPMDRLVCGDVGYGKTEIAVRAAFKAVSDNKQVAILVPTTILSLQHYRTFSRRLKNFPVRVENISRAKGAATTREILGDLESGKIDILIGTHKMLGKDVKFNDLGLLIIDEEQKFGVSSKEKLKSLKANVDTMTLTATPIPRTLQFSLMGARDLSIINTPPPNRQPVTTEVHKFSVEIIREAITTEVKRGGQVFFLHNKVSNIERVASILKEIVPDVRVVVAHGQMAAPDMERRVMDFIYGEFDVLLATTIIESGVDIPNANTIIINDAQNFGLSDLHQLRGRVGRTNRKAYCYLLLPDGGYMSEGASRRLKAIEDFSELGSGFNIAMQDLDIRGAGNILGGEQSGFISDIGFEAYHKILNEAIAELKNEEFIMLDGNSEDTDSESVDVWSIEAGVFVSDCQMDINEEAIVPDSYIQSVNEKINLYKQIDRISNDNDAERLKEELKDRFGTLPESTLSLFNVVSIRRIAVELGFEKAIVKNGYFILHFVGNNQSAYYKSKIFSAVLEYISRQNDKYKLKPKGDKLLLSIAEVNGTSVALRIIMDMREAIVNGVNGE